MENKGQKWYEPTGIMGQKVLGLKLILIVTVLHKEILRVLMPTWRFPKEVYLPLQISLFLIAMHNLRYADDTTFMAEIEEELTSLLFKMKQESENAGVKLNIQKTRNMASSPITSWQIDGEKVADFIFLDSTATVDSDCSHEI